MENTVATAPALYAIQNGSGETVDTAATQPEAFRLIDWWTRNHTADAPYVCLPVGA